MFKDTIFFLNASQHKEIDCIPLSDLAAFCKKRQKSKIAAKMVDKMYLSDIFAYTCISPRMLVEMSKFMFLRSRNPNTWHPE